MYNILYVNAAESMTGHIKNTMRRLGNVGRFNNKHTDAKNVQTMAAAALLRHSGYQTVLDALKKYRIACSTGAVSVAPKDAFQIESVKNWIFQ